MNNSFRFSIYNKLELPSKFDDLKIDVYIGPSISGRTHYYIVSNVTDIPHFSTFYRTQSASNCQYGVIDYVNHLSYLGRYKYNNQQKLYLEFAIHFLNYLCIQSTINQITVTNEESKNPFFKDLISNFTIKNSCSNISTNASYQNHYLIKTKSSDYNIVDVVPGMFILYKNAFIRIPDNLILINDKGWRIQSNIVISLENIENLKQAVNHYEKLMKYVKKTYNTEKSNK